MLRTLLLVSLWTLAQAAIAQDLATQLFSARSLKCHFGNGTGTTWKDGKPSIDAAKNSDDVVFDSIDLKKQRARMVGNIGANDVVVLGTPTGITFIDSQRAVLTTTTVFPVAGARGTFLASDSRHALISGVTLAEQYPGTCEIWQ